MDLSTSARNFTSSFRKSANESDALIVSLSPFPGFLLSKRDLGHDTLSVFESANSYYTFSIDRLADDISTIAATLGKRRVLILGSSKSAYGALFCGRSFVPKIDTDKCVSLVFSPVTRVYPLKKPLYFRTYPDFLELVKSKPHVQRCAERFGHLPSKRNFHNYNEKIYYGALCKHDENELIDLVRNTENPKDFMRIRKVPTSSHNVISMVAADKLTLENFTSSCIQSASRDSELPWLESDTKILLTEAPSIYDNLRLETIEGVISDELL